MRRWILPLLLFVCAAAPAQETEAPAAAPSVGPAPVTVEYYYRLKWGSLDEFKALYARNHAPLLEAMAREGFVSTIVMEEPFTHLAGGERWDLRVTVTYRDADSALSGPAMEAAWDQAWSRIYGKDDPEGERFRAEEAQRFAMVEEHWDVVVKPAE